MVRFWDLLSSMLHYNNKIDKFMIMGSNHAMAWWRILFILFCAFINLISISESHIVQNESWAFTHFLHGGARHILARWHQVAMGGHEGWGGTCSSGRWTTELGFSFDFGPMPGRAGGGKSTARPYVCGEESRSWMTFLSSFSSDFGSPSSNLKQSTSEPFLVWVRVNCMQGRQHVFRIL